MRIVAPRLAASAQPSDAADRAELRDLPRDAGEGAGIDDVRHILVSLGDFLIHGAATFATDNDASFLHLANNVAARGSLAMWAATHMCLPAFTGGSCF